MVGLEGLRRDGEEEGRDGVDGRVVVVLEAERTANVDAEDVQRLRRRHKGVEEGPVCGVWCGVWWCGVVLWCGDVWYGGVVLCVV